MNDTKEVELLKNKIIELETECSRYKNLLLGKDIHTAVKSADSIQPWHYDIVKDLTGMGVWQLEIATGNLLISDMSYLLFGYEPGSIEPKKMWEKSVSKKDQTHVMESIDRVVRNDTIFFTEVKTKWPDSSIHYLGGSGILISEKGIATHLVGITWDITQHWEKNRAIKFYDELIYGAMDSSNMGVFWSLFHRIFSEFDGLPIVGELLGIKKSEDTNMFRVRDVLVRLWMTKRACPEYKNVIQLALKKYAQLNKGEINQTVFSVPVLHKDHSLSWVEMRMYVKPFGKGGNKQLYGTVIDITESKNLEILNMSNKMQLEKTIIELEEAKHLADSSSEAKSLFLANMSHEIRTPLNAIIGLSYLLKDSVLDGHQKSFVENIESASYNLSSIVSDILDFSKIEAGELSIDYVDFEIRQVLEHVKTIMLMKRENKNKAIEIKFHIDERLPLMMKGDPVRLSQILINLGTNAVKFTETGFVEVSVTLVEALEDVLKVRFVVEDTGIGIELDDQKRLFKTFQQADSSTTRKYGGTGLGLAISKSLVELMGGAIEVDSQVNKGSQFKFDVDLQMSQGKRVDENSDYVIEQLCLSSDKKILVVEDNDLNQKVVTELLRKVSIKPVVAENGAEAMEVINGYEAIFDLIIMDLQMPEMDGYTATSMIRLKEHYKNIPIIVMTADVTYGVKSRIVQIGASDYIAKPVDAYRFYKTINHWLSNRDDEIK